MGDLLPIEGEETFDCKNMLMEKATEIKSFNKLAVVDERKNAVLDVLKQVASGVGEFAHASS
eukprot:10517121-Alexandrium_andersonii.AAC.1